MLIDLDNGPVAVSFDDTKDDGSFPAIMGFVMVGSEQL